MSLDALSGINSAKRLPIVFCLDVSPSMNARTPGGHYTRMDLLNIALSAFISQLREDPKACSAADVSLVTFSTNIERNDPFQPVKTFTTPTLSTVTSGGTNMANAILTSINKLETEKKRLFDKEIPMYLPFLVIVTDGNPDNNDDQAMFERAVSEVHKHCESHGNANNIIVPYVIGVGDDIDTSSLDRLAEKFSKGCFWIDDSALRNDSDIFKKAFMFIGNSIKNSFSLSGSAEAIFRPVSQEATAFNREIESIRLQNGGKKRARVLL